MKNLKKVALGFMAFMLVTVNVKAATVSQMQAQNRQDVEITGPDNGVYTVKLTRNSDMGVEVDAGEKVILDLAGFTLTNYCNNTTECRGQGNSAAIDVRGGELTIKDSTNSTGKITLKTSTTGVSTIANKGKLTIEGGEIAILPTAGNGLSTVFNEGELIINGGKFTTAIPNAAAVHNEGTLTINGGDFTTGINNSWLVSNNGTALIKGGTFTQNHNWSVIVNTKEMTIEDGEFKASEGGSHNSLITNGDKTTNRGYTATLNVTGGDFDAKTLFANVNYEGEEASELVITNGHFSEGSNIDEYLDNTNYEVDENGDIVLKPADYEELNKEIENAKNVDKTKYTEESVKALEEALEAAQKLNTNLTIEHQSEVDKALENLTNAIKGLKEVSVTPDTPTNPDTPTTPDTPSTSDTPTTPDETDTPSTSTTEEETKAPDVTNPQTGDNILTFVGLGVLSASAVVVASKKFKKQLSK